MTELNIKEVHHYKVSSTDLEVFINSQFGIANTDCRKRFDFIIDQGVKNDSETVIEVNGVLNHSDLKAIEKFRKIGRGHYPYNLSFMAKCLMDQLANDNKIPYGKYVVYVCL